MSDSNRVKLLYAPETTFNTVPSPAATFKTQRFTSESLDASTETAQSAEIREDRQIPSVIRTNISAQGDVNWELSYGAIDDLLEGWMLNTWAADLAITGTVAATSTGNKFTSDTGTAGPSLSAVQVGQWIKTAGFSNAANNGFFKVTAKNTAGAVHEITVTGATLVTEAAGAGRSINGSVIFNGTTKKSFVLEKQFTDVNKFDYFTGMMVNQFTLNLALNSIVTGSFSFIGAGFATTATATVGDGAPTAAPTGDVMNSIDHIAQIREGGALSTFDTTAISITGVNNLRHQNAVGTLGAIGVGVGFVGVTGNLTAYFEDRTMLDKYRSFADSSLSFRTVDAAGNAYVWDLGKLKFTSGEVVAGGQNADVLVNMNFSAIMDAAVGKTISVTRFAP